MRLSLHLGFLAALALLSSAPAGRAAGFADLTQPPATVEAVLADGTVALSPEGEGRWSGNGVEVTVQKDQPGACDIALAAPGVPVKKVHLRWAASFDPDALFLGDAWERAYGNLQWKPRDKSGPMPWYFLASDGATADGYGVMTGPAAFCCWKVDGQGVDLWADVRSGEAGVALGDRKLAVCTVVVRQGRDGESAFAAAAAFCRRMCPRPRVVPQPVYGFNDWYCAYGSDTAAAFLKDAAHIASLSPTAQNKPYMVIDDGWQTNRQGGADKGNPWKGTNAKFGSNMPSVAKEIQAMNARAGLWYRPLQAWSDCPAEWRLAGRKNVLDPSNPAVLRDIAENMKRFRDWGFELVKHDFSTNEITGRWGNQMGDEVSLDGLAFSDRSRTTAEIVLAFYRTLREAAGDGVLIDGCNTFSHLSAGIFEMARIGDDTSGKEWNRTLQMGVNCLAFRSFQNGAFYLVDADCAGLAQADAVPWEKNSQWLDLLARSGTPLFVSWPRRLVGPEQEKALRAALAAASQPQPVGEPTDWMKTKTPSQWNLDGTARTFPW